MNIKIESILNKLSQLTQEEKTELLSELKPKPNNQIEKPQEGIKDWEYDLKLRGCSENTLHLYPGTVKRYFADILLTFERYYLKKLPRVKRRFILMAGGSI
jgi:hypothetical protein